MLVGRWASPQATITRPPRSRINNIVPDGRRPRFRFSMPSFPLRTSFPLLPYRSTRTFLQQLFATQHKRAETSRTACRQPPFTYRQSRSASSPDRPPMDSRRRPKPVNNVCFSALRTNGCRSWRPVSQADSQPPSSNSTRSK